MPDIARGASLRIHYELDDFTDPWEKRPFLLLQHGNGRTGKFWYRWVPYLARHYRIIRPDMRGLGLSTGLTDLETEISLDALIDDVIAVLDDAGADSVHFCGESMGGILGMALAARHRERVRTLTLVSAPVFIEAGMNKRYSLGHGSRVEAMKEMGIREWVAQTTRITRLPADEEPGLFNWYVDEFVKGDPDVQVAMSKLVVAANAQGLLGEIEAPVLGLYPTGGQITSEAQMELLRQGLKQFRLVELPTGYHMVQLLYPRECTAALLDFCSSYDEAAAG